MAIPDKIAAAKQINELLRGIVSNAGLRLKYRISVDPPMAQDRDWEKPEILVEFSGPDSGLLLERGAELLRSIELIALEMLRLPGNDHEKVSFDCMNHRAMIHAVERDLLVVVPGQAQHFESNQLDRAQQLGAALQEQAAVGPGKFDKDLGLLPVAILRHGRIDGDTIFQPKAGVGDDPAEKFVDLLGGGDLVRNSHWLLAPKFATSGNAKM